MSDPKPEPTRRQKLHGLSALLLIAGGALYILSDTVLAAAAGLALSVAAGIILLIARRDD